ncbi:DUF1292 domain-containing protein [Clostridium hydrogeniformans]|uniref:DUF1292 domain-containing protein n=1 Tax=Clostridium hydrogeniformans TaxID=349933 RepID=UPI00047F198D|nr:DUF1292 domain-containing protein [Clostridium hydrogeniformans]
MSKEELKNCGCGCNEEKNSCGCNEEKNSCGCGEQHEHKHEHDHGGCGCGCEDHDHDHESFVVDLEDENGNVIPCEVVDAFEYKDNNYVLVQNPEDGSYYLFKSLGEEGELVVPDDKEFEEVSAYYETMMDEEE